MSSAIPVSSEPAADASLEDVDGPASSTCDGGDSSARDRPLADDSASGGSGETEGPDAPRSADAGESAGSSSSISSSDTEGPDPVDYAPDLLDEDAADAVPAPAGVETAGASEPPAARDVEASPAASPGDFGASRSVSESSGMKDLGGGGGGPNQSSFVALDLQEKVQLSGRRRAGTSVRHSPTDVPPIDAKSLLDLEDSARKLCTDADRMLESLKKTLHTMSAISVGCMQIYRASVEKTCDEVDANVKTMYAYMAKVEEVSRSFNPVAELGSQLNDIKRVLERLEKQVGIVPPL